MHTVRSNQLLRVQADQHTHADGDGHAAARQDNDHYDAIRQSGVIVTSEVTHGCSRTEIVKNNYSKLKLVE